METVELSPAEKLAYLGATITIFAVAWYGGEHPQVPTTYAVRGAVLVSAFFWAASPILPQWFASKVKLDTLSNSAAAAAAVYAGLAALHSSAS